MAEAIINRILEDARQIVNSTLEEGNKKASEIIASAKNDAAIYREKKHAETVTLREEIIRRKISVANLEVKKTVLAAKQEVLEKTYANAKEKILNLPASDYLAIIKNMISQNAESGDTVFISQNDKKRITKKFVSETAKELGLTLKLSSEYADISGGIILSGGAADKNLSLDVEFRALREETESNVAFALFGEL